MKLIINISDDCIMSKESICLSNFPRERKNLLYIARKFNNYLNLNTICHKCFMGNISARLYYGAFEIISKEEALTLAIMNS